jgi:hypothetical protein
MPNVEKTLNARIKALEEAVEKLKARSSFAPSLPSFSTTTSDSILSLDPRLHHHDVHKRVRPLPACRRPLLLPHHVQVIENVGGGDSRLEKGKRILLERRLQYDREVLKDAERLFPPARLEKPSFPFKKKKLAAMYKHDKAEQQRIMGNAAG